MTTHPAVVAILAALPGVTVERAAIRADGEYHHARRTILIRHGLRGPAWLSTLVHEALHAQRGDEPCCRGDLEARQEEAVCRDAARLLIPIRDLAEAAAAYAGDPHRLADELGVDYATVAARVRHLHPSEQAYLKRRLEHTEESA
jgi:hypothetical protein